MGTRRRLVRELPVDIVPLEWFPLHVPRAGSAAVTLRKADTAERSLGLRLFGIADDRGRSVTIEVSEETDPRLNCTRHILEVQVQPRTSWRSRRSSCGPPAPSRSSPEEALTT